MTSSATNAGPRSVSDRDEWLEADGLGGFASGTSSGVRTRRYHALLLCAANPPADRRVLVSGFVARLETPTGSVDLWPQAYSGGWVTGGDVERVEFAREPWPTWRFTTKLGVTLELEIFVPHGSPATVVAFRTSEPVRGAKLELRPLLGGRDFHGTMHENAAFRWEAERRGGALRFEPYAGVPAVLSASNGEYRAAPDWYRRFFYAEEAARGLDAEEDLASPGVLSFDLEHGEGVWLLAADLPGSPPLEDAEPLALVAELRQRERARRACFASPLELAADAYRVRRGQGTTLIAGYPWFGDWGRDTFIALRGLCLATGDFRTARAILGEWSGVVSEGMLPNRFPDDASAQAEYNAVDASLWFVLAVDELLADPRANAAMSDSETKSLVSAVLDIVSGYARGTRFGIRRDVDGLLAAGAPGVQLTWMDAKIGDHVVTPRIGKPIEVEALWVHALRAAGRHDPRFVALAETARVALETRFWNVERDMLFDVVDAGHVPGAVDPACRPNQIFAAGGLPMTLLSPERARKVVDAVERELMTPFGLRSLERGHPEYRPHYAGGVWERDTAYHQGTVWPWLIGPFVEAWVKSRGSSDRAKLEARARFLTPVIEHLERAGLGHVSEVLSADAPHAPGGCPFQAWSLSELLRLEHSVLVLRAPADRRVA
jgi:predicted glycogen debranching enzyme